VDEAEAGDLVEGDAAEGVPEEEGADEQAGEGFEKMEVRGAGI